MRSARPWARPRPCSSSGRTPAWSSRTCRCPGPSGIELCRLIKSSPQLAHIPVLLITSHRSTSPVRVEALSAGAQDFISRPIDSEELVAKNPQRP